MCMVQGKVPPLHMPGLSLEVHLERACPPFTQVGALKSDGPYLTHSPGNYGIQNMLRNAQNLLETCQIPLTLLQLVIREANLLHHEAANMLGRDQKVLETLKSHPMCTHMLTVLKVNQVLFFLKQWFWCCALPSPSLSMDKPGRTYSSPLSGYNRTIYFKISPPDQRDSVSLCYGADRPSECFPHPPFSLFVMAINTHRPHLFYLCNQRVSLSNVKWRKGWRTFYSQYVNSGTSFYIPPNPDYRIHVGHKCFPN